ncbi:MAG: PAS domain-containing protein [Bacteroidetes bacterium]|nr:PAS domain-containing protein [Bacteroidota bacterium]
MDNFINGAVLTFNKITSLKHLEYNLESLKDYALTIVETIKDPTLLLDSDLRILNVNTSYVNFFRTEQQLKRISFPVIVHELWKTSKLDQFFKKCLQQDSEVTFTHDFPMIGTKTLTVTAKPSVNKETNETSLVMVIIIPKS